MKTDDLDKVYSTMLQESVFSGNVNDDTDNEEDTEENNDQENNDQENNSNDDNSEEDSNDNDSEEDSNDNDSEDNSEDDSEETTPEGDQAVQSKIKTLQKQYNDILVDAFSKYAPTCIEAALEESEVAFGEDVEGIVQVALDNLRCMILSDFGIEKEEPTSGAVAVISPSQMGVDLTGGEGNPSVNPECPVGPPNQMRQGM